MSNTELEIVSQSSVLVKISNGQFEDAITELLDNPEAFSSLIKAVDSNIGNSKADVESIRDRIFFEKIFSNNVKDLADVLFKQNQTLAALFVMLQIQSMSGVATAKLLGQLLEYSKDEADTAGKEKGNLQQVAIRMLEYNTKELKKDEIRDKALMKCLRSAEILKETIENLNKKVNEATINYERCLNNLKNESAKVILEGIKEVENAKNSFDSIKNKLIEEKTNVINEVFQKITECNETLSDAINKKNASMVEMFDKEQIRISEVLSIYTNQVKKDKKKLTFISIISIVVALASIIITLIH